MSRSSSRHKQLPERYREDEVPDYIKRISAPREGRKSGDFSAPTHAAARAPAPARETTQERSASDPAFTMNQDSTAGTPIPTPEPDPLPEAAAAAHNDTQAIPMPSSPLNDTPESPATPSPEPPTQPTSPRSSISWHTVSRAAEENGTRPVTVRHPDQPEELDIFGNRMDSFGNPIEPRYQFYPWNNWSNLRAGAKFAVLRVLQTYFTYTDSLKVLHLNKEEITALEALRQPSNSTTVYEISEEDVKEAKRMVLANVEGPALEKDLCAQLNAFKKVWTTREEIEEGKFGELVVLPDVMDECREREKIDWRSLFGSEDEDVGSLAMMLSG